MVTRGFPVFLLLALAACGRTPTREGRFVTDDLGRRVAVPGHVSRIVTLAPNVTELVFAAGAGGLVAGVTDADDHPVGVASLPRVRALPVDHEAIVALRPDLVLASDEVNDPRDADRLQALGIPTYFIRIGALDDVPSSLRALGGLLGTADDAREAEDSLRSRLASLDRPERADTPAVLVLVGDATLFSFGAGSYVHEMVSLAGGRSITAGFAMRAPVLSEEFVLDAGPDVIVGAWGEDYDPAHLLVLHPEWASVPAVRNGRVYAMDPDLVLRPGPRLVEGTRVMAEFLRGKP